MLVVDNLKKTYQLEGIDVEALRGVSFRINEGDFVAIMGQSGSGKSTLMNLIGCLDRPTSGAIVLDGQFMADLTNNQLAKVRNEKIGFVFQNFNLLTRASALKNVELPLIYAGVSPHERHERAEAALNSVGLGDRLQHRPNQLSGGQQQRVAIARALSVNPALILADEPTGALDSKSGDEIMGILADLNKQGKTIILVTHEPYIAEYTDRVIRLLDGQIIEDSLTKNGARK
jgi:putative ABC transport system ATP-binding protein